NEIELVFTNFRARVSDPNGTDGIKVLDDNEVRKILKTSTLSERRKEVWEAAKQLGKEVEPRLNKLVMLRNQAAKKLGFAIYELGELFLRGQTGEDLINLLGGVDELTREPFRQAKAEIDVELAKACSVKIEDLMPWHYHDQFFQEVPAV